MYHAKMLYGFAGLIIAYQQINKLLFFNGKEVMKWKLGGNGTVPPLYFFSKLINPNVSFIIISAM